MKHGKMGLFALLLLLMLVGCGAPAFMSADRRFQPEPELIQKLKPYLTRWATSPPNLTEDERKHIGLELKIGIGILQWELSKEPNTVPVVRIGIETIGKWSRGYIYVYDGSQIDTEVSGWQLRKVDDYYYIYNYLE